MRDLVLIGLDVALTSTGWAVVRVEADAPALACCGVVRTAPDALGDGASATVDGLHRCAKLGRAIGDLAQVYRPAVVCLEAMSWPRNAATTAKMALAWGAVGGTLAGIALASRSPQAIKTAVAGSASATKAEVAAAVRLRFPNADGKLGATGLPRGQWEHAFDAMAAVLGCWDRPEVLTARQLAR